MNQIDFFLVDTSKLMRYSKDAAEWSSKLRRLEFARNSNNMPDVALFDFTSMYSATNASCAKKIYLQCCSHQSSLPESADTKHKYMLLLLCGDSLLEPVNLKPGSIIFDNNQIENILHFYSFGQPEAVLDVDFYLLWMPLGLFHSGSRRSQMKQNRLMLCLM